MSNSGKMLNYALGYARRGWRVLPLTPKGKAPHGKFVPHGVKDATKDEKKIIKWFEKSGCNIGVATGPKSGIWVLDIDGPVGAVVWWDWETKNGPICTLAQRTGRIDGGRQLFFRYPKDRVIKTRANIMSGIDVRGENGYVVAPPSIHPSGKSYVWEGRVGINYAPSKLLKIVESKRLPTTPQTAPSKSNHSRASNYGKVAVEDLLEELSSCARGGRDQTGFRVAARLLELENAGKIDPGTAEFTLKLGLTRNGYMDDPRKERGENGFHRIMRSARRKIE